MLLVLSLSWVSKRPSERTPGLSCLFVSKAITFKAGGRSYLVRFDPPRRVTYLVNFFTRASTDNDRCDGEELEVRILCFILSLSSLPRTVAEIIPPNANGSNGDKVTITF